MDICRIHYRRRRVIIGAASAFITAGALAGCSAHAAAPVTPSAAASSPAGPVINLSSLMFHPSITTVKVGTTITWRNDESITHTVTSGRFVGVDKMTGLRASQKADGTFNAKLAGKAKSFALRSPNPAPTPTTATFTRGGTPRSRS